MEPTISQMLKSPAFWFSTVVVGLIIEIVGSYFYSRVVEKWLSSRSEKRRKKLEEEKSAYRQKVEYLSKDTTGLMISFIRAYSGMLVVFVLMCSLVVVAFIGANRPPTGRVGVIVSTTLPFFFIFVLAMLRKAMKTLQMSRDANTLRVKAPLEEKENRPPITSAKRDSNKGVNRS